MSGRLFGTAVAAAALAVAGGLLLAGCGEKIAIPEPEGLFSVSQYIDYGAWADNDPRQLVAAQGAVFVVSADGLTKRDLEFGEQGRVTTLADARAVCADHSGTWIFVWEQGARQVSWFRRDDLTPGGVAVLDSAVTVTAMATSPAGIDAVPGALTFLYLSDPGKGVVWRYAFDEYNGLTPHGLLARSDGDAARFVHVAAGLARDIADHLLVCDRDTLRNWVIRFDAVPVEDDADLRGRAALFLETALCAPVAAADEYVIGNAAGCGQTDWTGGTSTELGEFNAPRAVAVDGKGRIFVADTGNDRVQIFDRWSTYEFSFGNTERTPAPTAIAVVDVRIGGRHGFRLRRVAVPGGAGPGRGATLHLEQYYTELNRKPPPPPD